MTCRIYLNWNKIISKYRNDNFGLYVTQRWKVYINPYTPRDTGRTEDTAEVKPWEIIYDPVDPKTQKHYARKIYYGVNIKFKTIHNPYATYMWDKKAEQAGQKSKLYIDANEYLHR